jgi:hypothetical protein
MDAMSAQVVEDAIEVSQSMASRVDRPSHANVRSTTHRRGNKTKPLAASDRLMISMVQSPWSLMAWLSFSPA